MNHAKIHDNNGFRIRDYTLVQVHALLKWEGNLVSCIPRTNGVQYLLLFLAMLCSVASCLCNLVVLCASSCLCNLVVLCASVL